MALEEQMAMNFGDVPDNTIGQDPVSGNDIPMGSTAENVRDDIPTMLSEGEIVVPADVVNFHGVKLFEDLRAEAKNGYAQMAEDGRIGGQPMDDAEEDRIMDIQLSEIDLEVMDDDDPVQMNRGGTSMKDYEGIEKQAKNIKPPKRTAPRKTHSEIMAAAFGDDDKKDNSPEAISARVQARKNKPKNRAEAIYRRMAELFDRKDDDDKPDRQAEFDFGFSGNPMERAARKYGSPSGAGQVDTPYSYREQPFYKAFVQNLRKDLGFDEGGLATDEDTNLIGGEDQFNEPFYAPDQKGGFDMDNAYANYGDGTGPLLEMREYMNDAGHRIFITFIDGVPQMEIPAGYYPVEGEGTVVAPTPPVGGSGGSDSGGSGGGGMDMPAPTPINYKELTMEELAQMVEDQKSMKGNLLAAGIGSLNAIVGGAMKVAMWNETRQLKKEIERRRDDPYTSEVDKRRYDKLLEIANADEPGLISTLLGKITGNDPNAPAVRTPEQTDALYKQLDKMTKAYTPDVQDASDRTTPGVDETNETSESFVQSSKDPIPPASSGFGGMGIDPAEEFGGSQTRFDPSTVDSGSSRSAPRTATKPIREESPRVQKARQNTQKVMKDMRDRGASREERNKSLKAAARTENVLRDLDRGVVRGFHKGTLVDKPKVKKVVKGLKKASKLHAEQAKTLEEEVKKKSK